LRGAELSETPIQAVKIPFAATTLPGYLCLADNSGKTRPLLIIQTGFDGTGEELYFLYSSAALARGYNCLLFEGPGQGQVIREQKLFFRANWETVITPVVDFALRQKVVEPERIGLMGLSMGGYLVPRAAAFEHRIKAVIANPGIYDFHGLFLKGTPPNFEEILDSKEGSVAIDKQIAKLMETNTSMRWMFNDGMWKFGASSPSDFIRKTRPYNMNGTAENITCPTLIVDSESDKQSPGQAKKLYDALRSQKEFMLFTNEEGAGEHCQEGAKMISNERVLNWLDGIFGLTKAR
jgi:alpha-beta hydrolase superfamily lysophospholipase